MEILHLDLLDFWRLVDLGSKHYFLENRDLPCLGENLLEWMMEILHPDLLDFQRLEDSGLKHYFVENQKSLLKERLNLQLMDSHGFI